MIDWKYFSKRRGVVLESLSELSYEEYCSWCLIRGVIPLPSEEWPYDTVSNVSNKPIEQAPSWTFKSLNKNKKADLFDMAKQNHVMLDGTETKKQIIHLLLGLHK